MAQGDPDTLSGRVQTLPVTTKFAYGIGQVAEGIQSRGFDYFAFFYFTQVLGLAGSLAGLAVAIALIFDAVTDPVAGHLSDNWRSRLGRRHPFMYASALPLGVFWCLLYFPPTGLGQTGLFLWLLGVALLVRAAMTLYHVPHMALGAELSDDSSSARRWSSGGPSPPWWGRSASLGSGSPSSFPRRPSTATVC